MRVWSIYLWFSNSEKHSPPLHLHRSPAIRRTVVCLFQAFDVATSEFCASTLDTDRCLNLGMTNTWAAARPWHLFWVLMSRFPGTWQLSAPITWHIVHALPFACVTLECCSLHLTHGPWLHRLNSGGRQSTEAHVPFKCWCCSFQRLQMPRYYYMTSLLFL